MELQNIKNRYGIIGNSTELNYAISVACQVAKTDLSVLIVGESGVGKEAFSKIIHNLSIRKHSPFIAVNCGAIPEGTIDSELFGHEKGAFTGAADIRKGYFETVNGGTIFLDEIGEMPLGTQARLLRVLETGEFLRVGSSKVIKSDVRVIAATNRELGEFIQKGKFREDLYYRLSTVPIRVPPLRNRKEDIPVLFRKFVVDFSEKYKSSPVQLDSEALQLLTKYSWKGNIRELKNIAEQISILNKEKIVSAQELSKYLPNVLNLALSPYQNNAASSSNQSATDPDIFYNLFFDVKKEVHELKKLVLVLLKNQKSGVLIPEENFSSFTQPPSTESVNVERHHSHIISHPQQDLSNPAIIGPDRSEQMAEPVQPEESLSIIDKEKELILKALSKHRGKRKNASTDLGISERTLYRKLKEYDIEG